MLSRADRVLETSTTTGTGDITVAGAVDGFRTFTSTLAAGDRFPYFIEAVDADGATTGEFETGMATLLTGTTFSRDVVDASSNSNALVSFSAGTKYAGIGVTERMIRTIGHAIATAMGANMV